MTALTSVPGHPNEAPASNNQAACWHSRAICLVALHAVLTTIMQKKEGRSKSCPGYSYVKHIRPV